MPNGKIGDHPFTDMMIHGRHPFPADIERMLRKLQEVEPGLISRFGWEPFDWAKGRRLEDGRRKLTALVAKHGLE